VDSLQIFISYSRRDGTGPATRLRDFLRSMTPRIEPWLDVDAYSPEETFPRTLARQIGTSDVLLYVMTPDSTQSGWCEREILYAQGLPEVVIVPLRGDSEAKAVIHLAGVPIIDLAANWSSGCEKLRHWLAGFAMPEKRVEILEERLRRLESRAQHAPPDDQDRHRLALDPLRRKIFELRRRIEDPERANDEVSESIHRSLIREQSAESIPHWPSAHLRLVNEPPPLPPTIKFRDRTSETRLLEDHLRNPSIRLIALVGRDGIGKTAMVSHLIEGLRATNEGLPVDAWVYLPTEAPRPVTVAAVLEDLWSLTTHHPDAADEDDLITSPDLTALEKLDHVLHRLNSTRVILCIDNAERLLDSTLEFRDRQLRELIRDLLTRNNPTVKILLVTRDTPEPLIEDFRLATTRLALDRGLPKLDAYDFLRKLDVKDALGLSSASEEDLERLREATAGHPRALELIYAILEGDPVTTLQLLTRDIETLTPDEDTVAFLVDRLYDGLDPVDRRVLQSLAAYGRAVPAGAVDHLLRNYLEGYRSESALEDLAERRLIRKHGDRFQIPPSPDGERILQRVPLGQPSDRDCEPPPLTRIALWHEAARFFYEMRRQNIVRLSDLNAQFGEIDLLMRGGEYDAAFHLITFIDDMYLNPWGYSESVIGWREELANGLQDLGLRVDNLNRLSIAELQQGNYGRGIDHLTVACRLATKRRDKENLVRLKIDLGSAYFENGENTLAEKTYRAAYRSARHQMLGIERVQALEGLVICVGEKGFFRRALRYFNMALNMVKTGEDTDSLTSHANLLLSAGWLYGELDRTDKAVRLLQEGKALAHRLGDHLLEGKFLDSEAQLQINAGHAGLAIDLARAAATIGARTRNFALLREANATLGLAYLCANQLSEARRAADAAVRHPNDSSYPNILGANAIRGIIAYRQGDRPSAQADFLQAHSQAETLLRREPRNYRVLDYDGLVLFGLTLCGDRDQLIGAIEAYQDARRITHKLGVVNQSRHLIGELGRDCDPKMLETVREAA